MSPISSRNSVPLAASSNLPRRVSRASVKAPFLVAEQFALQQRLGECGAVDRDERLMAAAALVVDHLGHDFLAGAVFAEHQNGKVRVGDATDRRAEGFDRRALANQLHSLGCGVGHLLAGCEELLPLLRVFKGQRRMGGQLRQGLLVVRGKIAADLVEHFKRTEQIPLATAKRHADERPCLKLQLLIDAAVDLALVGGDVGIDAPRLARLNHLADDAGVIGNPQLASFDAERRPADERVAVLVPQEDARPLRCQQLRRCRGHPRE